MAGVVKITGVKEVVDNLRKSKKVTAEGMEIGLIRAGLFIQRKSQKVVPVDLGNLKNSAFTRHEGTGFKTAVTVGYTAAYAVFVHEILEARHRPGKIAKYLENPIKWNMNNILALIQGLIIRKHKRTTFKRTKGFHRRMRG